MLLRDGDTRCYRTHIKHFVEAKASTGNGYSFAKLATATRIQRTFLSQVMNLKQHLSNDQIFLIAEALKIDRKERDHLVLIAEWERCKIPDRRLYLDTQLRALETPQTVESTRISGLVPDAWDDYFCDPHAEMVFRFLSIARYRNDTSLIKERLSLNQKRLDEIIRTLLDCKLIEENHGIYRPIKTQRFAGDQSPEGKIRHVLARMKVSEQKLKQRDIDEFLYNWWIICSPESKKLLKIEYLHLLERIYRESLELEGDNVYQLSLDLLSL